MSENNDYIQLPPLKKDTPSFIALIEYQKETKPQVNLKETLSQVNNKSPRVSLDFPPLI